MATITTRAGKGSPLTNTEVDDNFSNLNSAKYESGSAADFSSALVYEAGTGTGYGGLTLQTASNGGNAGFVFKTGTTQRFSNTLVGTHNNEYIRWRDLQNSRDVLHIAQDVITVNPTSADIDFKVNSDSASPVFSVDAGTDKVTVASDFQYGNISSYENKTGSIATSAGGETWIKLAVLDSPTSVRIRYYAGCTNAEEQGEIEARVTWTRTWDHLSWSSQTYRKLFSEVRLYAAADGYHRELWAKVYHDSNSGLGGTVAYGYQIVEAQGGNGGIVSVDNATGTPAGGHKVLSNPASQRDSFQTTSSAVFNEDGNSEYDFRVETNNQSHALFVDAGTDAVGIRNSAPTYVLDIGNSSHTLSNIMRWNVNGDFIIAGQKGGTDLFSIRNNSSSIVHINSANSAALALGYNTGNAGGIADQMRFNGSGVFVNVAQADMNFRISTENDVNTFHVDGEHDVVSMGTNATLTNSVLNIMKYPKAEVTLGQWTSISSDPGGAGLFAQNLYRHYDSTANPSITIRSQNTHNSISGAGVMVGEPWSGGKLISVAGTGSTKDAVVTPVNNLTWHSTYVTVNEGAQNNVDFRVESASQGHMLFVDAYENRVGVKTSTPRAALHVGGIGNTSGGNIHMGPTSNGDKWTYLTGAHHTAATETEGVAVVGLYASSTESRVVIGGAIYEANPSTSIQFYTHDAVTHSTGGTRKAVISAGKFHINNDQHDFDFQVSSDNQANMLYVDAANDRLGIKSTGHADATLDISGGLRTGGFGYGNPYRYYSNLEIAGSVHGTVTYFLVAPDDTGSNGQYAAGVEGKFHVTRGTNSSWNEATVIHAHIKTAWDSSYLRTWVGPYHLYKVTYSGLVYWAFQMSSSSARTIHFQGNVIQQNGWKPMRVNASEVSNVTLYRESSYPLLEGKELVTTTRANVFTNEQEYEDHTFITDLKTHQQRLPHFNGANANSYSTSTNLAYTKNVSQFPLVGEKLIATVNIRAYTQYCHIKTNVTSTSNMHYFRVKGYFYGYGINEGVIGGYTYYSGGHTILNKMALYPYRYNSSFALHTYRASDGALCLRVQVNHQGYTEGLAEILFHSHSGSSTAGATVVAMQHRDDGNNAF